jgi:hypothetical protein
MNPFAPVMKTTGRFEALSCVAFIKRHFVAPMRH